jgi:hypothetical protein
MAQQLFLAGLALSSIWEKARARDRQREVAGDKRQWGFVLQGVKPAAAQAAEWWQGTVLITKKMKKLLNLIKMVYQKTRAKIILNHLFRYSH